MLVAVSLTLTLLGLFFLWLTAVAYKRHQYLGSVTSSLAGLLLLSLAALGGTLQVATAGYRALTREVEALRVDIDPIAPQMFRATVTFPDGSDTVFTLAGDQVYVDAHILKWKPWANILGLHTDYELDRIGGRYFELGAERDSSRTIFSLKEEKPLDIFNLRTRYSFLAPLVDAEYGSGTFVAANRPMSYEVLVSTTGLLIRTLSQDRPRTD